jgi:hypothetical protein
LGGGGTGGGAAGRAGPEGQSCGDRRRELEEGEAEADSGRAEAVVRGRRNSGVVRFPYCTTVTE